MWGANRSSYMNQQNPQKFQNPSDRASLTTALKSPKSEIQRNPNTHLTGLFKNRAFETLPGSETSSTMAWRHDNNNRALNQARVVPSVKYWRAPAKLTISNVIYRRYQASNAAKSTLGGSSQLATSALTDATVDDMPVRCSAPDPDITVTATYLQRAASTTIYVKNIPKNYKTLKTRNTWQE